MDAAIALVRAYLQANGYFTVTEYPVLEEREEGTYQMATDVDVMAVRLPGAGRMLVRGDGRGSGHTIFQPDPALAPTDDRLDLLIAEVKEGKAVLNQGAKDPAVLRAILARFGAAPAAEVDRVVSLLIEEGEAVVPDGPRIRLLAFGTHRSARRRRYRVITLGHVIRFVEDVTSRYWPVMRGAAFRDPVVRLLMVLEKARRASAAEEAADSDAPLEADVLLEPEAADEIDPDAASWDQG